MVRVFGFGLFWNKIDLSRWYVGFILGIWIVGWMDGWIVDYRYKKYLVELL